MNTTRFKQRALAGTAFPKKPPVKSDLLVPQPRHQTLLFEWDDPLPEPSLPAEFKPRPDPKYRPRAGDVINPEFIDGATLSRPWGIPLLDFVSVEPSNLVPFTEIYRVKPDKNALVHFYEHDRRIAPIWYDFEKYLPRLQEFGGIIIPDFSAHPDFPAAANMFQTLKSFSIGRHCQNLGMLAVANCRVLGPESVSYTLAGIPQGATIAFGTKGCIKDPDNRKRYKEHVRIAVNTVGPDRILVCGSDAYDVFEYPESLGIPIKVYPDDTWGRSAKRVAL